MAELDKTIDLSQFTLGKALGEGSFGKVFEIREKTTGNTYAAKIILNPIDPNQKDIVCNLLREVNINASINHPSILQFIGFSATDFQNNAKPVIITELASNGSLNNVVEYENRGLSIPGWNDTKKIITLFGIASGMAYLHSHDILHRDLKLENILADDRLFPKITDFGLSKVKHENGFSSTTQSVLCIKGTPSYLSPEIIQDLEYTKAGDVYAFGIVAYEILTTNRAFSGYTIPQLIAAVLNGKRPYIDDTVPESYKQLIERCWKQNPTERPTFDEIVEELQNNEFITPSIEEEDYLTYIEFIQTYQTTYDENKKIIALEDIIKNYQSSTFEKVSLINYTNQIKSKRILPASIYAELNEHCQKLVDESTDDAEKQFFVGKYLIEGKKEFPIEIEYGIKYLERSSDNGCIDAALYMSELYYKGKLIPKNINKSKEYLFKYETSDDARIYSALGQILKKENFLNEARQYFAKGSTKFNSKSMYKYALMLMSGEGGPCDVDEAMKYFNLSKNQGYTKSVKYLANYEELNNNQFFSHLSPESKNFLI